MKFGRKSTLKSFIPEWAARRPRTGDITGFIMFAVLAAALITMFRRFSRYRLLVERVETEDAVDLIVQEVDNPDFVILDVRTPSEFERGHLAVAINLNYRSETFLKELEKLSQDKAYLVYSTHGERSGKAASAMKSIGFGNVFHLADGFREWERRGLPVVR
jgi:rhodanese-related sulfurtransferase